MKIDDQLTLFSAQMTDAMAELDLELAEFKQAFDEFDKVGHGVVSKQRRKCLKLFAG